MRHEVIRQPSLAISRKYSRDLIANDPFLAQLLDRIGAAALILFFLPLMILVALGVYFASPGPVLFKQKRIGRGGQLFTCYKFRTMVVDAEVQLKKLLDTDPQARFEWARDQKLRNDPRIHSLGNFLRKSSLDELPQLFNILVGDMSLVGPRPIVLGEAERYGRYFDHYCAVRPGLTGLWQISGRNDVSYRRRVAFDVIYVRRGTVASNLRILILTLPCVLASRGCY